MPPKKDMDRMNDWRTCIEESPLNEDRWEIKVVIFETAGSEQEIIYLNRFETYAKEEKRFVVKNICKSETIFMINQLGADKKVKDENLRVFEEGHLFLKEKKEIPPDVLALIIKHLILKMKDEYLSIQRQKLVVREGMRKESLTMIDRTEIKNNMALQSIEPAQPIEPSQTKSKGKKGEGDNLIPLQPDTDKKYSTLLRVRGEEWRDKVYVDDYPIDGPNLYLAITGFLEPYLVENLMKIGVPVTAIVQIRIDPMSKKISSGYLTGTKRGQSATELAADRAHAFWETLQKLRLNKNSADVYKYMAFIVFNPPYRSNETLSSRSEKIYDELSYLLYDLQDLTRQHRNYLDNMDIKCLPTETKNDSLLKLYHKYVDGIPLESVTIFSIIESLLQTISNDYTDNVQISRSSLSTAATLLQSSESTLCHDKVDKAETLVNQVFTTLSKNDFNGKKYRLTCGEEYHNFEDPMIINYGDYAKYNSFHLGNLKLDNVILTSLVNMPICNFWKYQKYPSDDLKAKINFHINTLISCFDRKDLDDSLLNRLIHMLSFRKLYNNRSSLRNVSIPANSLSEFKKMYLKRSTFAEPLLKSASLFCTSSTTSPASPILVASDSYNNKGFYKSDTEDETIKLIFTCPDISELVSAAEIMNNKPLSHFIEDYDYFEDFAGTIALQQLLEAFNKFNCLNYKYCEVTDSFLMIFFNDHDVNGIYRNEWRCHLPTPICLQDFFDFVLEEQFEWVREEEKTYDEIATLKTKLELKESLEQVPVKSCIENIDELDSEFLIKGSLKYQDRVQSKIDFNEEEDQNQTFTGTTPMSSVLTEADSKSNKTKSSSPVTKKKVKEEGVEIFADAISYNNQGLKQFSGFNLGDRRVEVFGRDSAYFSLDGTKVSTFYTIIIPMNLEHLILNVISGNGDNEFCIQKTLGDMVSFNPESFRITSKNQVLIYFKKNVYQTPVSSTTTPHLDKRNSKESLSKTKVKQASSTKPQASYTKMYHSFFITWPNGLVIESVHSDNSSTVSHIKQFFNTPTSYVDEDMRCFSLNGEVIAFKKSGIVEVFQPDGTYIKIKNCSKNAVYSEATEDTRSAGSSEKGKKGKGYKSKEKFGKTTSKSSKNTLDQNENLEIPTQYQLSIDEFEIIDGNGLQQRWINNHLISSEKVLIRTATDFCLGEILSRRMDGTSLLINKDGIQFITFHDNTRIITTCFIEEEEIYPDFTESIVNLMKPNTFESTRPSKNSLSQKSQVSVSSNLSSDNASRKEDKVMGTEKDRDDGFVSVQLIHTIEHANFATVVINKANRTIMVESANKTKVTVDTANNYNLFLDESTSASFDGEHLNIIFKACHLCHANADCKIKINHTTSCNDVNQYWLTMKDSFGKNIVVDDEGAIHFVEKPFKSRTDQKEEEIPSENLSEACLTLRGKCKELYEANMFRFFVLHRDLTCSELVHRTLVDQYKSQCRWQPWCSIREYDTFGDHRNLVSILTPIELTESEKWLMRSKYSNRPKQLKYKDLKVDTGKGFYHWMRPYERFQPKPTEVENIKLPRLPRAYVLRTLEQLWKEEVRDSMKGGKEIIAAVLRYRRLLESESQAILSVPIKDPRTVGEKELDNKLQDIAQRIYNDLKNEISDEIQAGAKVTITTKPQSPRQKFVTDEMGEVASDELKKKWQEKNTGYVREVAEAEKLSPSMERYWLRRADEAKREEFYKQLLREESIPPYFRNILGGAVWWDVNQTANDAVTIAQTKTCVCVKSNTCREPDKEELQIEDTP